MECIGATSSLPERPDGRPKVRPHMPMSGRPLIGVIHVMIRPDVAMSGRRLGTARAGPSPWSPAAVGTLQPISVSECQPCEPDPSNRGLIL